MRCYRPSYFRMPRIMQENSLIREKQANLEKYIHNVEDGVPIFTPEESRDTCRFFSKDGRDK
ncbi:MAG TPA: hypothetical protein PKK48_05290 [Phycisphaerae bacterium]|nr:hypothetical protein [Phycisphaerae bacterium]HPS52037.1 hypothetical protein [Phycisphaerae bacterium]